MKIPIGFKLVSDGFPVNLAEVLVLLSDRSIHSATFRSGRFMATNSIGHYDVVAWAPRPKDEIG